MNDYYISYYLICYYYFFYYLRGIFLRRSFQDWASLSWKTQAWFAWQNISNIFIDHFINRSNRSMSDEQQSSVPQECVATEVFCVSGVWETPNKHEPTHPRLGGNAWVLSFVYTKALLAGISMYY